MIGTAPVSHVRRIADRTYLPLLLALVAVDLAFVAASVGHLIAADGPADRTGPWLLETDGGYAEVFGYLQQGAIALLLLSLGLAGRHWVFLAWGSLYACALADDSLRLHETKGAWLADRVGEHLWFPDGLLGLRANDLGEMIVWGLLAVVPLLAVVVLHRRSDPATRRTSRTLAVLLAAYVVCGGVLDQLHVLVMDTPIGDAVGTLEDGGELVALSATVAYVIRLLLGAGRPRRLSTEPGAPSLAATGAGAASVP